MPLNLAAKNRIKTRKQQLAKPLWEGPMGKGPQGGCTQSLLGRTLVCSERARVYLMQGWKASEGFSVRMEYGNLWHSCEQGLAANDSWEAYLQAYGHKLLAKYPLESNQIIHWVNVCQTQFPIYVEWWSKHPDVQQRIPLLQEQVFDVPYRLPSGRMVRLRGKFDSVDIIGKGKDAGIWIAENKSKGDINELILARQLSSGFDIQCLLYCIAIERFVKDVFNDPHISIFKGKPQLKGVRYNVVRRPLAGGKYTISKHKEKKPKKGTYVPAETDEEFYNRLGGLIQNAVGPDAGMPPDEHYFFRRWEIKISQADIARFKRECLDPILENLCDDYEWWEFCHTSGDDVFDYVRRRGRFPLHINRQYRLPFGCYNPLLEGRASDLDEFLLNGSTIGLQRVNDLFPELKE